MFKWFLGILFFLMASCQNIDYSGKGNDVPTQGDITMGVDYGDSFVMAEFLSLFRQDYPKANITVVHTCELNLLRQLRDRKFGFVVMNRDLSRQEKDALQSLDVNVRSALVGKTSIALIVNPANPVDSLSISDLKKMLTGELSHWNALGANGKIQLVFDEGCGSNYQYFSNVFLKNQTMYKGVFGKKNPREILEYVANNKNALGFVSLNWIADRTDSASVKYVKNIKVLAVENSKKKKYYLPFQSQIAAAEYPFLQEIYMHDFQGYSGLAQGFIAWSCSQPGQILMKKSGLIPAHDMGRTIYLTED
ncbi:MAG: substrate-binding domain-containing protein [Bacteroidetes bacterium]|nr:substrate-binding domain-containing protein [Bacteroidota bacterium]